MMELLALFQTAAKEAWRFPAGRGQTTLEDLYQLPLNSANGPSLESVAQALYLETKDASEVSFTGNATTSITVQLARRKLELVKHVIEVKQAELAAKAAAKEKQMLKGRLNALIAEKQDQELSSKSIEELRAISAAMD